VCIVYNVNMIFYYKPIFFLPKIHANLDMQIRLNGEKFPYYVSDKYGIIYGSVGLFLTLVPILALYNVPFGNGNRKLLKAWPVLQDLRIHPSVMNLFLDSYISFSE
jgi:hypothetical protein